MDTTVSLGTVLGPEYSTLVEERQEEERRASEDENKTCHKIEYKYEEQEAINADKVNSIKSGESVFKLLTFETSKYNSNTAKCIAFWKAISESDLKPVDCTLIKGTKSISDVTETASTDEPVHIHPDEKQLWLKAFEELRKRKMDKAALAATPMKCKICGDDDYTSRLCCRVDENLKKLNTWKSPNIPTKRPIARLETSGNDNDTDSVEDKEGRKVAKSDVRDVIEDILNTLHYDVTKEAVDSQSQLKSIKDPSHPSVTNAFDSVHEITKTDSKLVRSAADTGKKRFDCSGPIITTDCHGEETMKKNSELTTIKEVSESGLHDATKMKAGSELQHIFRPSDQHITKPSDNALVETHTELQPPQKMTGSEIRNIINSSLSTQTKTKSDMRVKVSDPAEVHYTPAGEDSEVEIVNAKSSSDCHPTVIASGLAHEINRNRQSPIIGSSTIMKYVCKCGMPDCKCNTETDKVQLPHEMTDYKKYSSECTVPSGEIVPKFLDKETETEGNFMEAEIVTKDEIRCNICGSTGCICQEKEIASEEEISVTKPEGEDFSYLAKAMVSFAVNNKVTVRKKAASNQSLDFLHMSTKQRPSGGKMSAENVEKQPLPESTSKISQQLFSAESSTASEENDTEAVKILTLDTHDSTKGSAVVRNEIYHPPIVKKPKENGKIVQGGRKL